MAKISAHKATEVARWEKSNGSERTRYVLRSDGVLLRSTGWRDRQFGEKPRWVDSAWKRSASGYCAESGDAALLPHGFVRIAK